MSIELFKTNIKYVIEMVIIYLLFKYVPNEKINDKHILLIALVAVMLHAMVENVLGIQKDINNLKQSAITCNKTCSVPTVHKKNTIEGLEVVQSEKDAFIDITQTQKNELNATNTKQNIISPNTIIRNDDGSYIIRPIIDNQATSAGSRSQDGVVANESQYSYTDFNNLPVKLNEGSFEYGYSFLPPENWYPTPPHPPVCVSEKTCPVCPVYTNTDYIDLKEWNPSRRITPPDRINVKYIEEKLNSGR
jgi:hypothetical protein